MNLQKNARALRAGMTDAERHLWYLLRDGRLQGAKFRRQRPMGKYIADFVCIESRLVVELDGSQHLDSAYDAVRDAWLHEHGWCVLRFWNDDVLLRTSDVLEQIALTLNGRAPSPGAVAPPSPTLGRGEGNDRARSEGVASRDVCSPSPPSLEGGGGTTVPGERNARSRGGADRAIEARSLQSPLPSVGEGAPSGAGEGDRKAGPGSQPGHDNPK